MSVNLTCQKGLSLVNGHEIYTEVYGLKDSPPLILLHHGLGACQSWVKQIPALVTAGWQVIAYDRWGYGKSQSRSALSIPSFQQDIQDLRTLVLEMTDSPVVLVGHSDGGTIACGYAANYPVDVSALVCIAAHIYIEDKMGQGIEAVRYAFENHPSFVRKLRRIHGDKTEVVFWNWYNGWTQPDNLSCDMRSKLVQVACPTLIIQGFEDEHATSKHAVDLAASISQAETWLIPGGGHMIPQEFAEQFNCRLLSFLEIRCLTKC
jgi:pimeloyl-ACP methyl ester carboxylesterase